MVIKKSNSGRHVLKLLSVVISLLLWVYVANSEHITVEKSVELEVLYPDFLSPSEEIPKQVVYALKGPRAIIKLLLDKNEKISIDLRNQKIDSKHQQTLYFKNSDIDLPIGVIVQKIQPTQFKLEFDEKIKKHVPVILNQVGYLSPNFKMKNFKLHPNMVEIYGPKKEVSRIKEVNTTEIDVGNLKGLGKLSVGIVNLGTNVNFSSKTLPELHYEIVPIRPNLVLKNIVPRLNTAFKITSLKPNTVSLMVYAQESTIDSLSKNDVEAYFEMPEDKPGIYELEVKIKPSQKFDVYKILPEKVKITIQ